MEVEVNLITKRIKCMCDECGNGEMVYIECDPLHSPRFKHQCVNCECVVYYEAQYPLMVYVEV